MTWVSGKTIGQVERHRDQRTVLSGAMIAVSKGAIRAAAFAACLTSLRQSFVRKASRKCWIFPGRRKHRQRRPLSQRQSAYDVVHHRLPAAWFRCPCMFWQRNEQASGVGESKQRRRVRLRDTQNIKRCASLRCVVLRKSSSISPLSFRQIGRIPFA